MHVQCISQRPNHSDIIYGTGNWDVDEIKDVPDDVAKRLLDHKDVYARPKAKSPKNAKVEKVVMPEPDKQSETQEFYDKLAIMTKEQAHDWVETNFGMKVDMRKYPTDDAMRAYARMLFEQYGVV
jgi:hypothetical protein